MKQYNVLVCKNGSWKFKTDYKRMFRDYVFVIIALMVIGYIGGQEVKDYQQQVIIK